LNCEGQEKVKFEEKKNVDIQFSAHNAFLE
jgi:hypothetical protein